MKGQLKFDIGKPTQPNYKYLIQKWRNALQKYCDDMMVKVGGKTGYCACGCMRYCNYCDGKQPNECVRAIRELADEKKIEIDWTDYDFEKLIEKVEE